MEEREKSKPPIGPQFFKQRLGPSSSVDRFKGSISIQVKNESVSQDIAISKNPYSTQNSKQKNRDSISSIQIKAQKDYRENVGMEIKHTTTQLQALQTFAPNKNLKYELTLKNPISRMNSGKKISVTAQKFKEKDEKDLQKAIKTLQHNENHDLYDNINLKNLKSFSPDKYSSQQKMTTSKNGSINFINPKNVRNISTSAAKGSERPKKFQTLASYYQYQESPQIDNKFELPNKEEVQKYARTLLFENESNNPLNDQRQSQPILPSTQKPILVQKVLMNNNYSLMLNSIQKKKRIDQLQNRFQQTINMLPQETRSKFYEALQKENEMLQEQQKQLMEIQQQEFQTQEKKINLDYFQKHKIQIEAQANKNIEELEQLKEAQLQEYEMKKQQRIQELKKRRQNQDNQDQQSQPEVKFRGLPNDEGDPMKDILISKKNSQEVSPEKYEQRAAVSQEQSQVEVAEKIKYLIEKNNQMSEKVHENIVNSIMRIEEEQEQPNPQQKQYRVTKEQKKIKKYFKQIRGGLEATPNEEMLKTRTFNQATYYYIDDQNLDQMKRRRLEEEKLITNFVSEREAFLEKQNREKRVYSSLYLDQINEEKELLAEDFLKKHRINAKIFTADTILEPERTLGKVKSLKPNTNKKHSHIQKSVMLIQTLKFQQAKQFLTNALKEFPDDVTLLFNKGLAQIQLKEYEEAADIYEQIKDRLNYKNAVLINLFICLLYLESYEELLKLSFEIQKSDNFLDSDERNLRLIVQYALEKFRMQDFQKYQEFMKNYKKTKESRLSQIASLGGIASADSSLTNASQIITPEVKMFEQESRSIDMTHNQLKRQWSVSNKRNSRQENSIIRCYYQADKALDKRKSSADTEVSVQIKQGLAMYIAKKSENIIKSKEKKLQQKIFEMRENFRSSKRTPTSSQRRSEIKDLGYQQEVDLLDRLDEEKIKKKEETKQQYAQLDMQHLNNMLQTQNLKPRRKDLIQSKRGSARNLIKPPQSSHLQYQQALMKENTKLQNDLSVELTDALQSLELEMTDTREYFLNKINKLHFGGQNGAELHFDPVQQEFKALMQEVELLKRDIGGEQELFEFIQAVKREKRQRAGSSSRKNSEREQRPWNEKNIKKENIAAQIMKYKAYSRAINLLLDTNNNQMFYKDKEQHTKLTEQNKVLELKLERESFHKRMESSHRQASKRNLKSETPKNFSHQSTFKKNQPQKIEIEESMKDIEERLKVYETSKMLNENEEERLMRVMGITKEQLMERKTLQKGITGHILMPQNERDQIQKKRENDNYVFDKKTQEFVDYLFQMYGLKEVIVPDTQGPSLFKDIQNIEMINDYINKISVFATNRSSDVNHLHKYHQKKRKSKTTQEDKDDSFMKKQEGSFEKEENSEDEVNEIENFQRLLEIKVMEGMSSKKNDECEFYNAMLQKLNTIDILQTYLKKCALQIRLDDDKNVKKELSFAMLQIFREQISKKEIYERQKINLFAQLSAIQQPYEDVDYDLIDKIVKRLKFFKIFDQRVRNKLYRICRYQIVPPNKIIVRKEEIDQMIIVIINGSASLMVKDLAEDVTFSVCTLFPGESLGDVNLTSTLKHKEDSCQTYVMSDKECDVLAFDRKEFANVLFQEMKESLYEKIITLKNSEFFESISPYALVILCSNIEIKEYSYGDVIVRQEQEPEFCFIIVSGECKIVYETVVYKPKDEFGKITQQRQNAMSFGFQSYNPSEKANQGKKKQDLPPIQEEKFCNQKKLNEKFSFQNEKLELEIAQKTTSNQPNSKQGTQGGGIFMGNFLKQNIEKEQNQLQAFRHHIFYDKLVQGKCFCARTLLEKDYVSKFIQREYDEFNTQLQPDLQNFRAENNIHSLSINDKASSFKSGSTPIINRLQPISVNKFGNKGAGMFNFEDQDVKNYKQLMEGQQELERYDPTISNSIRLEVAPVLQEKDPWKKEFYRKLNIYSSQELMKEQNRDHSRQRLNKLHDPDFNDPFIDQFQSTQSYPMMRDQEIKFMYDQLMKSQLTVIADSARVKVIVISRKSKKYLSEPLKAVIDNKILNLKFKDYDRPFKNISEINKFLENEKNWEQYKYKVSQNNIQQQN